MNVVPVAAKKARLAQVLARRNRGDNQFLPAALEILETPASPIRTAFLWFICILAASCLLWTWLGTFDIVATAQGKVQPIGRVKIVQSTETGRTKSAPVSNGSRVKAGDVLVELDKTEVSAEENGLVASLQAYRAEVIRRQAVVATMEALEKSGIWTVQRAKPDRTLAFPDDIEKAIRLREQGYSMRTPASCALP